MRTGATAESDILILGAGLTGMSAASVLGDHAIVLEREDAPGGLVRTERFGEYWFDRVLHILYFDDTDTECRVRRLLGEDLVFCPPEAWVETKLGTVRFPFQFHLDGLDKETAVACLMELAELTYRPPEGKAANFEEKLRQMFGRTMCEVFYFPYNRKVWKRPLRHLVPSGFTWNISPGEWEKALRGLLIPESRFASYNADGWYPRPPEGAAVRGMEVLSRRLAREVPDLRLRHAVTKIDLDARTVTAQCNGEELRFRFMERCCSTIPLPEALRICPQTPPRIRSALDGLTRNRVVMAAFSIRGPRPTDVGHWRYFADESLAFTRLIYPHRFDPLCAPPDGWGLMAEIVEPAEWPQPAPQEIFDRATRDIQRCGRLPRGCEIVDRHLIVVDPGYAVFSLANQEIINEARQFLESNGVTPLGRYGRWSYTSMAQVMRDGFRWGSRMSEVLSGSGGTGATEGQYLPARQIAEETGC